MEIKKNFDIEILLSRLHGAKITPEGVFIPFSDNVRKFAAAGGVEEVSMRAMAITKKDSDSASHYIREKLAVKDRNNFKKHPILGHLMVQREFESNPKYVSSIK